MRFQFLILVILCLSHVQIASAGDSEIITRMDLELAYPNDRAFVVNVEGAFIDAGKLSDSWLDGSILIYDSDDVEILGETFTIRSGQGINVRIPQISKTGVYEFELVLSHGDLDSKKLRGKAAITYPPEFYDLTFLNFGKKAVIMAGESSNLTIQEWIDNGDDTLMAGRSWTLSNDTLEIDTPFEEPGVLGIRYDVVDQWGWTNNANTASGELRGAPHAYYDSSWAQPNAEWVSLEKPFMFGAFFLLLGFWYITFGDD